VGQNCHGGVSESSLILLIPPRAAGVTGAYFHLEPSSGTQEPLSFYDFSITGNWAKFPILSLADQQIIKGFPDKTFRPEKVVMKAQLIRLLTERAYCQRHPKMCHFRQLNLCHFRQLNLRHPV